MNTQTATQPTTPAAALTFQDLCGILDSDPRLRSAYPFLPWAGQDAADVADAVFRRWESPYWPGSCAANRAWEPGELDALSDLHVSLTGETCHAREKREEIEAEKKEAEDDRLVEAAARVMRGYRGTRLYGALRRAGLEAILRPHNADLYEAAARLAAR
jgi:hypothetical protein